MASLSETTEKPARVLVEEPEASVRQGVTATLTSAGYECSVSEMPSKTAKILASGENVDLVLCGIAERSQEHLDRMIRPDSPWNVVPVVISTGDVGLMAKVLEMGAYDVLFRPFQQELLIFTVRRALEYRRLKIETLFLRNRLGLGSGLFFSLSALVQEHRKSVGSNSAG